MHDATKTVRAPRGSVQPPADLYDTLVALSFAGELPKGLVKTVLRIAREETRKSDARIRGGLPEVSR